MATITGASVTIVSSIGLPDREVIADCFGNNMAIVCPACERSAILLIARPCQRGSAKTHPGQCPRCLIFAYILDNVESRSTFENITIAVSTEYEGIADLEKSTAFKIPSGYKPKH